MGGIVSFIPDLINKDEQETIDQRIIVNEIRVSGETRHFKRSVIMPDTIILNKGEDDFQVFFSSSDFTNSDKTVYRYKLSGINDNWIDTDSHNRSINYANLKPGLYNLQLQASDRIGAWSAMKDIVIRIHPYFYQTLFFRIAVPLAFLLLITGITFMYIRQLKQRAAQQQDALRLQSLQGQMNPHFIFNSLNSINYFISKNDTLSANRYIADFSKLIRSILYNFNSDFITLEKEIESLDEYLKIEHLRFGDKFNYKVVVESGVETARYKVSPGLVQPFVENAIWYGVRGLDNRKGNVMVRYTADNEKLTCIVEDDGIGRKNAEALKRRIDKKESRGISLVTERLRIINKLQKGTCQVCISDLFPDRHETGTKVIIDIPFKKN
jgi:anti-sigma regulatory factor (Ser/Thr protein kinase)